MATTVRAIHCDLQSLKPAPTKKNPLQIPLPNAKILLQPRLCTLRSYASDDRSTVVMTRKNDVGVESSPFFEKLSEYIDSSKKSSDFEIISGRIAMMVFAATVTVETVTGNSLFKKMDVEGLTESAGACLGAMILAASFAYLSSARTRVNGMLKVRCNAFIDSLIDQIVDGLFYEDVLGDRSDEI